MHLASSVMLLLSLSCASAPLSGPLSEGMGRGTRIVAVDSARPPAAVTVQLEEAASVAVLLVIPGHSATLLYPRDSATDTRRPAGQSTVAFQIPGQLVRLDSGVARQREGMARAQDSTLRRRRPTTGSSSTLPGPIPVNAATLLLVLSSPQPLHYQRIIERTAGVSIPTVEEEALNAVAKAVRSTLPEPRTLSGYYQEISITR